MLLAEKRKRREVAGKVHHPEYIYRLNGDPREFEDRRNVRPQGDLGPAQNYNRDRQLRPPPFAVDDEGGKAKGNRMGDGDGRGPHGARGGGAGAAVGEAARAPGGPSPSDSPPFAAYHPVPFSGGGGWGVPLAGGGGGGGGALPPRPAGVGGVLYSPTLPPLPLPTGPLPGPLPSAYHPKPPLIFHPSDGGAGGGRVPIFLPSPYPAVAPPVQSIELSPTRSPPIPRPLTSPALLLPEIRGVGGREGGPATPQRRRSVADAGDFIFGGAGGGLSEQEEKLRERQAARQRAQELQEANAQQMAEQQRRRAEAKAREAAEARLEEARLQRERDERARREQAELDREAREKELKMMGPRAAAALVAQQEADKKRKEEEAQAKRDAREAARKKSDAGSSAAASAADAAPSDSSSPPPPPPPAASSAAPTAGSEAGVGGSGPTSAAPPPAVGLPSGVSFALPAPSVAAWAPPQPLPSWLTPPADPQPARIYLGPLPTHPYPAASSLATSAVPPSAAPAASLAPAPAYTYETENVKRELHQLVEQQRRLVRMLEDGAVVGRLPPFPSAAASAAVGGVAPAGTYLRAAANLLRPSPAGVGSHSPYGVGIDHLQPHPQLPQPQLPQPLQLFQPNPLAQRPRPPALHLPDGRPSLAGYGGGGGAGTSPRPSPHSSPRTSPGAREDGVVWKLTPTRLQRQGVGSNGTPLASFRSASSGSPPPPRPVAGVCLTSAVGGGLSPSNPVDRYSAAAGCGGQGMGGGGGGAPLWDRPMGGGWSVDPYDLAVEPSKFIAVVEPRGVRSPTHTAPFAPPPPQPAAVAAAREPSGTADGCVPTAPSANRELSLSSGSGADIGGGGRGLREQDPTVAPHDSAPAPLSVIAAVPLAREEAVVAAGGGEKSVPTPVKAKGSVPEAQSCVESSSGSEL